MAIDDFNYSEQLQKLIDSANKPASSYFVGATIPSATTSAGTSNITNGQWSTVSTNNTVTYPNFTTTYPNFTTTYIQPPPVLCLGICSQCKKENNYEIQARFFDKENDPITETKSILLTLLAFADRKSSSDNINLFNRFCNFSCATEYLLEKGYIGSNLLLFLLEDCE